MSMIEFLRLTPREFNSMMKIHIDVNSPKDKKKKWKPEKYIDQVF
jgi:hypothetical protein